MGPKDNMYERGKLEDVKFLYINEGLLSLGDNRCAFDGCLGDTRCQNRHRECFFTSSDDFEDLVNNSSSSHSDVTDGLLVTRTRALDDQGLDTTGSSSNSHGSVNKSSDVSPGISTSAIATWSGQRQAMSGDGCNSNGGKGGEDHLWRFVCETDHTSLYSSN